MTKTLSIFLSLMCICITVSCGHKHTASEIVLDNGKKWSANPETTTGIHNMIKLMDEFNAAGSEDDYEDLEDSLEDEFNLIFKNCTMTGEAHNQLHNFLLPMKDMFDQLESDDLSQRKNAFETLKAHLMSYPDYFQ